MGMGIGTGTTKARGLEAAKGTGTVTGVMVEEYKQIESLKAS